MPSSHSLKLLRGRTRLRQPDGFAVGEQAETYWSIRIFELAIRAGVKHFIYRSLDAVYKKSGYNPKYYVGHYEGKSRVVGALALPLS